MRTDLPMSGLVLYGPARQSNNCPGSLQNGRGACHDVNMTRLMTRKHWLDVVGPVVLSTIIFTAVLVGFGGRSVGYAVGFSLTVNAANAMCDWLRSRRQRVNLSHGGGRVEA